MSTPVTFQPRPASHTASALAAAEVERNARAKFARLVDEDSVGCAGPHLRMLAAVGVPEGRGVVVWPVVLGGGKPALPTDTRAEVALLDVRRFSNGVAHLCYRPL